MTKKKRTLGKTTGLVFLCLLLQVPLRAQTVGISTNALGWVTLTPNIGIEAGFARHWSVSLDALVNPFTWGDGRKTQVWAVQPEIRFWPRHKFAGHVIGLHGQYGQYDWALHDLRYRGDMKGSGISYGYAYMPGERWNIEASIGFGYNRFDYRNRYDRRNAGVCFGPGGRNCWGVTRVGIKFTYFIK